MKSLSLLSLATVAFGALSDMKLDGLKLDGFDFDSLDILGGKAAAVKKPWYLGGPLPSKGPFGASIPIHLFLDEYANATIIDIGGVSFELACLPQETGGSITAIIFNVVTGKEISGLFDVGSVVTESQEFDPPLQFCGSNDEDSGAISAGLFTFLPSGTAGPNEFLQPFSCVYDVIIDPNPDDEEQQSPIVIDLNHFISKYDDGVVLNVARESLGIFTSNTTANSRNFDALCGVWGNIDIKIPKGVEFSVPAYAFGDPKY